MTAIVVDTQSLIWFLLRSPKLSPDERSALNQTVFNREQIHIASISVVEMIYLADRDPDDLVTLWTGLDTKDRRIQPPKHRIIPVLLDKAGLDFLADPTIWWFWRLCDTGQPHGHSGTQGQ